MAHESIYDITYSCNKVVCHEEIIAFSFDEAMQELELILHAEYFDVLGFTVEDLPQILQGQNL